MRPRRMTATGPAPLCCYCARKHRRGPGCEIFPRGIPEVVFSNEHDHRLPYPGDGGKRFVLAQGMHLPEYLRRIRRGPRARLLPRPDPALEKGGRLRG